MLTPWLEDHRYESPEAALPNGLEYVVGPLYAPSFRDVIPVLLVEPPFACIERYQTHVANISGKCTALHWISNLHIIIYYIERFWVQFLLILVYLICSVDIWTCITWRQPFVSFHLMMLCLCKAFTLTYSKYENTSQESQRTDSICPLIGKFSYYVIYVFMMLRPINIYSSIFNQVWIIMLILKCPLQIFKMCMKF